MDVGLLDGFEIKKEVARAEEQERWHIGDKIENNYEIHHIKKGGFGVVYICYDHEAKEPVAIKTFQAKYIYSQKARDDFKEEADKWINLDKHKNIVKAKYVKNIEGQPYIFLEYVAGGNLDDWLYTKILDLPLALNFAIQFCIGMEYAYNKMKLVHRDIKPGNILLTKDKTVKITDFGLAKAIEARAEKIEVPQDVSYVQSSTAGTIPYMAPEQFTDREIDARADIYAFGIVLYQMVAEGDYPYVLSSNKWSEVPAEEWLKSHLKGSPKSIQQNIPSELKVLIYKCLEKKPANRYQKFSELKRDISKIYFDMTGECIIEESPEDLEAWELVNKGTALGNLGKFQEALACYDEVLEINPRYAKAWHNKGFVLGKVGRLQEALVCIDKSIDINPKLAETWTLKGVAMRDLGRFQEALVCIDKSIDINPRLAETWTLKGAVLRDLGIFQEALACYDKSIDINPKLAETWYNKGIAMRDLGRFQEEIACYNKALDINQRYDKAWVNKGSALGNLGRHQEALACCDESLDINPQDAEAWTLKGIALRNLGRFQEALACYDESLDINPRNADTWYNKGVVLGDLGRFQEALACCDKSLDINPGDADTWYNKGVVLHVLGRPQEALTCCDKAIEINPKLAEAWYNKGIALRKLGRAGEALACYDKAIKINPRFAEALYNKGNALRNLGKYKEAILSFQKFIEVAPPQSASNVKKVKELIRLLKKTI